MAHRDEEKKRARERRAAELAAKQARARRIRILQVVAAIVVVAAVVAGGIWWQISRSAIADASPGPQIAATKSDTAITLGTGGATVDLYEDFLCPHCADLEDRLGPTLNEMVTAGDITLALHPVTLIDDEGSARAASAFACAADTGTKSMLGYQSALFANQSGDSSAKRFIAIAKAVGITGTAFTTCVNDEAESDWAKAVDTDARTTVADVTKSDSFGTPTIIVNGHLVDLAHTDDPEDFRATVQELAD